MRKFTVTRGKKKRTVEATEPLSAVKKAFRSSPGWHWEKCRGKGLATVVVDGKAMNFDLIDNG